MYAEIGPNGRVAERGIAEQFPYSHLAAVIAFNDKLGDLIIKSCLQGVMLDDIDDDRESLLLEGHIHGEVPYSGGIKKIVLAESSVTSDVAINAAKFAEKWKSGIL